MPVYLDDEVMAPLVAIAERRGIGLDELVNDVLKKEPALAESLR